MRKMGVKIGLCVFLMMLFIILFFVNVLVEEEISVKVV